MRLDDAHPTLAALQRLAPETNVAGGSFAGWLPHPCTLQSAVRVEVLASARRCAVDQCIRILLQRVGLPINIQVRTGDRGDRLWPAGFAGSITHKGTVVLGVIAETASIPMVGIDLERMARAKIGAIEHTIAPEGLPRGVDRELATLLAFSAKEAVFKAGDPVSRWNLGFSDVSLAWLDHRDYYKAEVQCPVPGLEVRCICVGSWVLSAALAK